VKVAPATPRLVDRGGLLAALDRAAAGKVTIISAPAGSGKTSLLRAWADRPRQPHRLAVVQVQRDQHDAQQFWLALLDAARHASGTTSRAEAPAATPGSLAVELQRDWARQDTVAAVVEIVLTDRLLKEQ
jgi:LuxR family maltose regulon positive regulatory protein